MIRLFFQIKFGFIIIESIEPILKDVDSLQKVRELAVEVIEYKRNDKSIEQVFSSQVKAAMKEPDSSFVLGIYYDTGRLFLFKRIKYELLALIIA